MSEFDAGEAWRRIEPQSGWPVVSRKPETAGRKPAA